MDTAIFLFIDGKEFVFKEGSFYTEHRD